MPRTNSPLVRRFIFIGLVSVGPAALLSGWFMAGYLPHVLLDRERDSTVGYVRQAVARAIPEAALRESGLGDAGGGIAAVGQMLLSLPEAVRVKVFDGEGTVVWSDEPRLVGANFRSDRRVGQSLVGAASVALEPIRSTPEHAFEVGRYRELTSVYVPILVPETDKVALVFEVYKLPDVFHTWIREGRLIVWSMALGTGVLLLVSQISLVRGAARTISRQHADLEQRAGQVATLNDDLRHAQDGLIEAERLATFGEAAVAVAHGLRNPLANIRALAQEAREGLAGGDPCGQSLEDIVGQVDRLEARLRAFLACTGPAELSLARERISSLVHGVVVSIRGCLGEAGVTVHVDVPDDVPEILADRPRLEQVIQEILTNSMEAGARTVRVSGRADTAMGEIQLAFEDDGRGLASSAAARAFDLFFTTKPAGTGVGLTAVRRVVQEHGGAVSIAPRPEGGVVVNLRLPPARPGRGGA